LHERLQNFASCFDVDFAPEADQGLYDMFCAWSGEAEDLSIKHDVLRRALEWAVRHAGKGGALCPVEMNPPVCFAEDYECYVPDNVHECWIAAALKAAEEADGAGQGCPASGRQQQEGEGRAGEGRAGDNPDFDAMDEPALKKWLRERGGVRCCDQNSGGVSWDLWTLTTPAKQIAWASGPTDAAALLALCKKVHEHNHEARRLEWLARRHVSLIGGMHSQIDERSAELVAAALKAAEEADDE